MRAGIICARMIHVGFRTFARRNVFVLRENHANRVKFSRAGERNVLTTVGYLGEAA